jgi:hypothetical protein
MVEASRPEDTTDMNARYILHQFKQTTISSASSVEGPSGLIHSGEIDFVLHYANRLSWLQQP